jgi:hypothetical protein
MYSILSPKKKNQHEKSCVTVTLLFKGQFLQILDYIFELNNFKSVFPVGPLGFLHFFTLLLLRRKEIVIAP